MAFHRSSVYRNLARQFLDASGLDTAQAAALVGIEPATLQAFADDPRLLPDLQTAMRFMAIGGEAAALQLLSADPLPQTSNAPLSVLIVGGGNLGHVFCGLLGARADIDLRLLLSSAARAEAMRSALQEADGIRVELPDGSNVLGRPRVVTHDAAEAVPGAQLILLCVPSHAEVAALDRILPWVDRDDACIGSVPAPGGFDWKARAALQRHGSTATVFGLGYIPWMCKTTAFGRSARILGGKPVNVVSVLQTERLATVADLLARVLQTPVLDAGSFLNLTLHPGNQLLHPALMYAMFHDWDGTPLPEPPLFYENATPAAAALCQQLSDELQQLKAALEAQVPGLQLPLVMPLHEALLQGYSSAVADPATLHSSIVSNRAYAGIRTPMLPVVGGCVPDWQSRFFLEDVPHGLVVLRGLADLLQLRLPQLDALLQWSQQRMGREYLRGTQLDGPDLIHSGAPAQHGIYTVADLFPGS